MIYFREINDIEREEENLEVCVVYGGDGGGGEGTRCWQPEVGGVVEWNL